MARRRAWGVDPSTVGVGIISWRLDEQPAFLDHVLDHRPRAVWLSFGDPTPYLAHIHDPGGVAVCQVLSLQEATSALQAGADVLVVQGSEAGGRGRAGRGLLSILPAVVDLAGRVPVVAAGGIATGRQLAACWTLGAARVVLGTRLYATHEAADSDTASSGSSRCAATTRCARPCSTSPGVRAGRPGTPEAPP